MVLTKQMVRDHLYYAPNKSFSLKELASKLSTNKLNELQFIVDNLHAQGLITITDKRVRIHPSVKI